MSVSFRTRIVQGLLTALVALLGAGLLWVSGSDLMTTQGPSSLASFYRPPLWARLLALALVVGATAGFVGALLLPRAAPRKPGLGWTWGALLTLALGFFALSLHTVVISALDASIHDVWGIWPVQRVAFDGELLPREAFHSGALFLDVDGGAGNQARIFLGIPPWRIDADPLLSHPGILSLEPRAPGGG